MFTGIITDIGTVREIRPGGDTTYVIETNLELGDLAVPPGELRRPLARARRVRIAYRIHTIGLYGGI